MSKQTDLLNLTDGITTDSNGNVGIGTDTPTQKLNVNGRFQIDAGWEIKLENAAQNGFATIQNAGAGTNTDLGFSTAGSERMRIDSAGRVTMPYQPAFHVLKGSNQTIPTGTQNTKITMATVVVDQGGNFSTGTSRYTVPVSGKYYVAINIGYYGGGTTYARDVVSSIRVNNVATLSLNNQIVNLVNGNDHASHTVSGILSLSANDYLEAFINYADHTGVSVTANSVFYGHLIG